MGYVRPLGRLSQGRSLHMNESRSTNKTPWPRARLKNLPEEAVIDPRTGELRGTPEGMFEVHQRSCPTEKHLHILWYRGTVPRKATVFFNWEYCSPYREVADTYLQTQQRLGDLFAVLLTLQYPEKVLLRRDEPSGSTSVMVGSTSITLSPSLEKTFAAWALARKVKEGECVALQVWCHDVDRLPLQASDEHLQGALERAQADAGEILQILRGRAVTLLHPALPCPDRTYIKEWLMLQQSSKTFQEKMNTPLSLQAVGAVHSQEYDALQELVCAHEQPLRFLLSEQQAAHQQQRLEQIRARLISEIKKSLPLDWKTDLTLSFIRTRYQEEKQSFQTYRTRWKESIDVLQQLPPV